MKSKIIERLGETDILLPSLIEAGLLANARVSGGRLGARGERDPHQGVPGVNRR